MTTRRLIVNADDFGFAAGVNEGIVEAHVNGILTSTSLMVDRPAAGHAARTFATQLEHFRDLTGSDPTHVDSHHHVHMSRLATFAPLVAPLGVPLRGDGRVPWAGARELPRLASRTCLISCPEGYPSAMDRDGASAAATAQEAQLRAREDAQSLAALLDRTALTLERSASLADEHARRRARNGQPQAADDERRAARGAREASRRARAHAERCLELSGEGE